MYETRIPYGVNCDWYSLGTMLYELAEKAFPFGLEPEFEDPQEEYRQPDLIDPATGNEMANVDEMHDLLAGLLDWDPDERLSGETLRAHPYWRSEEGENADWELIEQRRMPSPLRQLAQQRIAARRKKAKDEAGMHYQVEAGMRAMAKQLSASAADQAKVDAMNDDNENAGNENNNDDALADRENEMRVDDWEYSSPHAISVEYMESIDTTVSVL